MLADARRGIEAICASANLAGGTNDGKGSLAGVAGAAPLVSWCAIYNELKGWQAVVGSVLGFGGLIAGALFNAHLNRKRDDRLREAEAITIALSLYGEIKLLRESAADVARALGAWFLDRGVYGNDLPEYYREIFQLRQPVIFAALASKIGMMNPSILLPITAFYSDYESALEHFPKLFKNADRIIDYGPEWVLQPAARAVEGVEVAVRRIEELGKISTPTPTPSIGRAKDALDLIEDLRPHDD